MRGAFAAAVYLPAFLTGVLVKSQQVAVGGVVTEENEKIPVEDRRAAVSPLVLKRRVVNGEMAGPYQLAVHIDDHDLSIAEPGVDALTVSRWSRRRQVVFLVKLGKLAGGLNPVFPQLASVRLIKRFDHQEDRVLW